MSHAFVISTYALSDNSGNYYDAWIMSHPPIRAIYVENGPAVSFNLLMVSPASHLKEQERKTQNPSSQHLQQFGVGTASVPCRYPLIGLRVSQTKSNIRKTIVGIISKIYFKSTFRPIFAPQC